MRVVILVPRRPGFADRDAIWTWTRAWWAREFPDLPIYEGEHLEGLFNRSLAVNRAAAAAGAWDVALIIDSDVIGHPPNIREAIDLAASSGRLVVPFTHRHNLSRGGSQAVMAGARGSWRRWITQTFRDQHSSVIAVPRRLWDQVGGFDEAFRGWGQEDTAFAIATETVAGPRLNLEGEVWHFHHDQAPEGKRGTPSAIANRARLELYRIANGDAAAVLAVRSSSPPKLETGIPRILHRVIPERVNAAAEAHWSALAALHPDWDLTTHRDPLDPAAWPETRGAWRHCQSGASLADLIRLEALWKWGGIYVDWDCRPVRRLDPLLPLEAFAAWEDARTVPNAVMGARPGHPAIRECLDRAILAVRRGTWDGGPGVTTAVLPGRSDVLLLPPETFYPVHYRDPERDALMAGFDPAEHPATFLLHEYWGSWLEPERRRVPAEPPAHVLATASTTR